MKTEKNLFEEMLKSGKSSSEILSKKWLLQICDENKINKIVQEYNDNHTEMVDDYMRGRKKLLAI